MVNWIFLVAWVIANWNLLVSPPKESYALPELGETIQPDCSGLLSQREFGQVGNRQITQNGKYAAGQFVGRSFMPLLYFNSADDARVCAPDMEIAKWENGAWVSEKR